MRLSDIPVEATASVDANVPLAYILEEQRADLAEEFLLRVENREISALVARRDLQSPPGTFAHSPAAPQAATELVPTATRVLGFDQ